MFKKLDNDLDNENRNKRGAYKVLAFPQDIDINGTQNIMFININVVEGSKQYIGKKYKIVDGDIPVYQQSTSGSLARKMKGATKRIDKSIALYIPNNVQTSYGSDWNTSNLESVGAVFDAGTSIGDLTGVQGWKQIWEAAKNVAPDAMLNTLASATQTLTGVNTKDAKQAYTRSISNPYTEVIFNGVQNRSFSFTFKFIPKSEEEQKIIKDIIDLLKFHRAPEIKYGNVNNYLTFPSEFDIMFLNKGIENEALFKISTCAMTNMSVSYGGENSFSTYKDGSAFSTELTLDFMEMEVLSKERHKEGF
jgi:hypothetical protein